MGSSTYPKRSWLIIGLIATAISLCACSTNLSRGQAQRALEAKYATERQYEYIQTGHDDRFGAPTNYVRVRSGQWRSDAKKTAALADAGFVKVEVVATSVPMSSLFFHGSVDHIVVTPTLKASPFLAGTFQPGDRNGVCSDGCLRFVTATPAISIASIGEPADLFGRKVSIVTFEVSWTNTPIGDLLGEQHRTNRREATFVKSDSGWQLER